MGTYAAKTEVSSAPPARTGPRTRSSSPHTVLPSGLTVFEETAAGIERAYVEGHVRPLLELGS